MSDRNELTTAPGAASQRAQASQGTRSNEARPALPAVDVYEDAGGITVLADMPGVRKDGLDVRVDGDSLSIEGRVELDVPGEMRALWAELGVPRFRRTFTLSRELDANRIEAALKDGVLTLRVPKQAHAQPRRIEVTTA